MFKINDKIREMTGYIVLDDQLVCFQNSISGETEIKKCKIELFGGAIKATPNEDINNVIEFFEPYQLSCEIKGNVDGDIYLIEFNNLLIIAPIEGYNALSDYITMVKNGSDYFESVYESQSDEMIDNSVNDMSGIEFEKLCGMLLQKMGFDVEQTKASGDGGIDLIATNSQPFLEGKYIIQCKRYLGSVGEPFIRDLYGVVCSERANKGILITTGTFTNNAVNFAVGKQLELIDGNRLSGLLEKYQINNSIISNEDENSLTKILKDDLEFSFDYEEFSYRLQRLKCNPNDEITRIEIIKQLLDTIINLVPDIHDYSKILIVIKEIKSHISLFNSHCSKSNGKIKYMKDILSVLNIQLNIIAGNFNEAIEEYIDLMHQPEIHVESISVMTKDLQENPGILFSIYAATYNAVQLAIISGNRKLIDRILRIGNGVIKALNTFYFTKSQDLFKEELSEDQIEYYSNHFKASENIQTLNSLYFIDSKMIEKCMNYVYYKTYFDYQADLYSTSLSNNSLIIKECDMFGNETDYVFVIINNVYERFNNND